MTEFAKTCKQVEFIFDFLESVEHNNCWGGHMTEVEKHREELFGSMAEKMRKFRARVDEPDPNKRTYGPAMETKVKKCLQGYEELLEKFGKVAHAVACNHEGFALTQNNAEEARAQLLQVEQLEVQERNQIEKSQHEAAQDLRQAQLQEGALREEECRRQLVARRQERERASTVLKEAEARHEVEVAEHQARQSLEEYIRARRQKEEAREEKRRRLGTILEQHRLVKEKGEHQLIAEALALSLQEARQADIAESSLAAAETKMDIDEEPSPAAAKDEQPDVPPAADMETEEMLIKQAIELSLQLSTTAQLANGGPAGKRADNSPGGSQS